jgi:hypothetical protein
LGQGLSGMKIQKKGENPIKNYAIGENWEQESYSLGWWKHIQKINRLKSAGLNLKVNE